MREIDHPESSRCRSKSFLPPAQSAALPVLFLPVSRSVRSIPFLPASRLARLARPLSALRAARLVPSRSALRAVRSAPSRPVSRAARQVPFRSALRAACSVRPFPCPAFPPNQRSPKGAPTRRPVLDRTEPPFRRFPATFPALPVFRCSRWVPCPARCPSYPRQSPLPGARRSTAASPSTKISLFSIVSCPAPYCSVNDVRFFTDCFVPRSDCP